MERCWDRRRQCVRVYTLTYYSSTPLADSRHGEWAGRNAHPQQLARSGGLQKRAAECFRPRGPETPAPLGQSKLIILQTNLAAVAPHQGKQRAVVCKSERLMPLLDLQRWVAVCCPEPPPFNARQAREERALSSRRSPGTSYRPPAHRTSPKRPGARRDEAPWRSASWRIFGRRRLSLALGVPGHR